MYAGGREHIWSREQYEREHIRMVQDVVVRSVVKYEGGNRFVSKTVQNVKIDIILLPE